MERQGALQIVLAATIVLIVLVITSNFGPYMQPATSNESAAVANLRTINTAEVTYLSSSGGTYGTIADLIAAGLLDDTFTGIKAGYKYSITLDATGSVYTAEATPASTKTGRYRLLQPSGCSGPLFNERFACSGRSVRTFRPVGASVR